MFVFGNLLIALATAIHAIFQVAWWTLIARILMSWFQPNPSNELIRSLISAVYNLTDPVLDRVRRALPFLVVSGLDLSPVALFIGLGFVDQFTYSTLVHAGYAMM